MALDPPAPSLDAVTRACYARGLSSETWLSLVRQAAEAAQLDRAELERQLSAALVALLISGTAAPTAPGPPLVAAYLSAALDARMCGPAAVARAACAPSPSSPSGTPPPSLAATESILRAVLHSLDAPSAPPPSSTAAPALLDPAAPLSASLLPQLAALVPLVVAHPRRAPCTATYLARLVRGAAASPPAGAEAHERAAVGEQLRRARLELEGLSEAQRAAEGAHELCSALRALEERVAPRAAGAGAALPHALEGALDGSSPTVDAQEALAQALRAVRDAGLGEAGGEGMDVDGATPSSSSLSQTFDSLIVALCQRELLSPNSGPSIIPHVDASELQPAMIADYSDRLAGAGQDEVKQLLDELVESHVSQQAISSAIAEDLSTKSTSHDVVGLSTVCDALVEHRDALAVLLLHVEAREVLGPVRAVLDEIDTSQDDFGDGNPIERYGGLVLFVQLVASRFKLQSNLAHHLGSASSFFTTWLPSCSAVYALSTLSDDERSVVSGWIGALFGEGISDDLMHATNPRTLLRVAPTILKQSLMARQAGVVDLDSLRDALSYFLQELLRFTLPGVLLWLVEEVERTPASPQQLAMLDILQTLVLAPSLPPSITELVAPSLVRLLLDPSISALPSSALDRVKLIKLVKPFRPASKRALRFAAPQVPADEPSSRSPHEAQLRTELMALVTTSTSESGDAAAHGPLPPARTDLARSFARVRAHGPRSHSDGAFLRVAVLPALFAAADSASSASSAVHAERAVVALIGSSSSSLGAAPGTAAALLPVLVGEVVLPDLETWVRTPVAAGAGVGEHPRPQRRRRRQVELVADVVCGAAVWELELERRSASDRGEEGAAQRTKRTLQLLSDGVAHARRSVKRATASTASAGEATTRGARDGDEVTVLDVFVERLASWPDVVEVCPALAVLAAAHEP
ncbi:hypothetical protein JCM9279_000400 [Rhodotorula babjevae]